MKVFSASQIKACDAYTIHAASISSYDLMERAAARCVEWITAHVPKDAVFAILCGTGNNGGDGLAITRMLHRQGYGVKAFLLQFSDTLSADCKLNLERLQNIDAELVSVLQPEAFITDIPSNIIVIDAILGTGLNRQTEGWVAEFIEHINEQPNRKIAIDIPSGMPADIIPSPGAAVLQADQTLSFQFYKRSFFHEEMGMLTGEVEIIDIGLNQTFINATQTNYLTLDADAARAMYKPRKPFSHKGTYGDVLMIAGSYGMMGAAVLAVKAALRSGAGKVRAFIPECGYTVLQTAVPEAMCNTKGDKFVTTLNGWEGAGAIGIGPGLGMQDYTARAFADFIEACKQPIVIDADGLNLLAKQPEIMHKLPHGSIITPHPKEFERLFGKTVNSMLQAEQARMQAMKYNINIVLKGHHTLIANPEGECWYNVNGNAGMATGGSGDVLTGIITGLLAQGYAPNEAALLGVYLHGAAGDIAAAEYSQEAMVAGDIIDNLGGAFKALAAN